MTDFPKTAARRLILASTSPYRRELLSRITPDFEVYPPNIDESCLVAEQPVDLAERLARHKALAVAKDHPDAIIIASDQVAALGARILRKPGNSEKAAEQLGMCSGKSVHFFTSACVLHLQGRFDELYTDITTVNFRELTRPEIEAYVAADQPLDCAGSFRAEGLGVALFTAIDNRDPTALIGLPLIWLTGSLMRAGIRLLDR